MANLTAPRNTYRMGDATQAPMLTSYPIEANTLIYAGSIVVRNANGNAVNGGTAVTPGPGLRAVGACFPNISTPSIGATSGQAAGSLQVPVREGTFKFLSGTGLDAIVSANAGQECYVIDDQTVGLTDGAAAGGSATRVPAGVIHSVDADGGVFVTMSNTLGGGPQYSGPIPIFVDLTALANGTVFTHTPTYAGRVKKLSMSFVKTGAGAGATATLTVNVAGTAITGQTITPTLANSTAGTEIAGTNETAASGAAGGFFNAGQAITVVASAVTVFTAGEAVLFLHLQ